MSSQTMRHSAAIFAKRRASLLAQRRTLVWCQSANVTFERTTNVYDNLFRNRR